jgi:aspartyl-tRNA(Asn)/glutamyl-tRNA(Gln) amidotransferase subunit B
MYTSSIAHTHTDITQELVNHLRTTLPALPDVILTALTTDPSHGLTMKDAKTLLSSEDGDRLEYYLDVHARLEADTTLDQPENLGRAVGNWYLASPFSAPKIFS